MLHRVVSSAFAVCTIRRTLNRLLNYSWHKYRNNKDNMRFVMTVFKPVQPMQQIMTTVIIVKPVDASVFADFRLRVWKIGAGTVFSIVRTFVRGFGWLSIGKTSILHSQSNTPENYEKLPCSNRNRPYYSFSFNVGTVSTYFQYVNI